MRQAIFEVKGRTVVLSEESGWVDNSAMQTWIEFARAVIPYPPEHPVKPGYDPDPFGTFAEYAAEETGFKLLTVDAPPPRPEYDANGQHILY